jgi:hypothetical protein
VDIDTDIDTDINLPALDEACTVFADAFLRAVAT